VLATIASSENLAAHGRSLFAWLFVKVGKLADKEGIRVAAESALPNEAPHLMY